MLSMLGQGFGVTLQIFFLTLVGSLPLGVVVALARMSRVKPIAWIMKFYISVMRGTPLMLQMFFIYFAPYYIFGIPLSMESKFSATIVAFIINYAAYFAEIYRSGIQSIPRGQYEAAEVLGYSRLQTFMKIVLPQVIKRILPAMGNEIITLVKDTSLAFAIGVAEMFSTAKALVASQVSMLPFVFAAVFYWVFNFVVEVVWRCRGAQRHLARGSQRRGRRHHRPVGRRQVDASAMHDAARDARCWVAFLRRFARG